MFVLTNWSLLAGYLTPVALCIAFGCSSDSSDEPNAAEVLKDRVTAIKKLGGKVVFDYMYDERGTATRAAPPANLSIANVTGVYLYDASAKAKDGDLKLLKGMENLQILNLSNTDITNDGLRHLVNLSNLQILNLSNTGITDDGLRHLVNLSNLQKLHLNKTAVTNKGLEHLKAIETLDSLGVSYTTIDDSGLMQLQSLRKLKVVRAWGSGVTRKGKRAFEHKLPDCTVMWNEKGYD